MYFSGTSWPQAMVRWMATSGSRQVFSFHGLEVVLTSVGISGIERWRNMELTGEVRRRGISLTRMVYLKDWPGELEQPERRPGRETAAKTAATVATSRTASYLVLISSGEDQKLESYSPRSLVRECIRAPC